MRHAEIRQGWTGLADRGRTGLEGGGDWRTEQDKRADSQEMPAQWHPLLMLTEQ
jgi:hypothetical protein